MPTHPEPQVESRSRLPPQEDTGGALVELRRVGKVYGEGKATRVHALRDVDLSIRSGELAAIVGPSGSGKSTLLHILGCLDRPSEGKYFFDARDTSSLTDRELSSVRNQRIGFVFQAFHLLGDESALGNVMLPLIYRGDSRSAAVDAASRMLERVGLGERLRHRPGELSGGEQQRVAIARALVKEPDLILADEPTGNLDSTSGDAILELIERANRDGITVVLITHDPAVASRARRIFTIRDGAMVSDRSAEGAGDSTA